MLVDILLQTADDDTTVNIINNILNHHINYTARF